MTMPTAKAMLGNKLSSNFIASPSHNRIIAASFLDTILAKDEIPSLSFGSILIIEPSPIYNRRSDIILSSFGWSSPASVFSS